MLFLSCIKFLFFLYVTGLLGELYMRSLKVTILPLIVSSVIAGKTFMKLLHVK